MNVGEYDYVHPNKNYLFPLARIYRGGGGRGIPPHGRKNIRFLLVSNKPIFKIFRTCCGYRLRLNIFIEILPKKFILLLKIRETAGENGKHRSINWFLFSPAVSQNRRFFIFALTHKYLQGNYFR